jgi:hypothetical protein
MQVRLHSREVARGPTEVSRNESELQGCWLFLLFSVLQLPKKTSLGPVTKQPILNWK